MIPTNQTILHDPENGINGNCFSAVLASLLHLDINDVPVFTGEYPEWQEHLNEWLRPYGLAYIQLVDFKEYCETVNIKECHHEISGTTNRFNDVNHACVGYDGVVQFDPHPSKDGLSKTLASGVFIILEPWRIINHG